MAIHRVLIVDPDRASREALLAAARAIGLRAQEAPGVRHVRERLASSPPDLLLIDPGPEELGTSELEAIREQHPDLPVVLLRGSTSADVPNPISQRNGFEELRKSCTPEALEQLLERLERSTRLRQENEYLRSELLGGEEDGLVARSAVMAEALRAAARSARSCGAVLITGEPGTGKRRVARYVHLHSPRRARPIVRATCAESPPAEVEARLFGPAPEAERGARFATALLEVANGGTLLLDEVSGLSESCQVRLLAALEGGRIEIVGCSRPIALDVRVIATSRRDLLPAVAAGSFLPDLHRLLSALPLHLRPLRERVEDVLPLAELFAARAASELGLPPARFSPEAERQLLEWSWPGNARELECVVRRAAFSAQAGEIGLDQLALGPVTVTAGSRAGVPNDGEAPEDELGRRLVNLPIADIERIAILATLRSAGGNKTEAGRRLGLTARTLSNKLKLWRSQGWVA